LLSAEKIEYTTWADHIDLKTGKPVENPDVWTGKLEVVPSAVGAHSVPPQAFSPLTGLLYIPTIRTGSGTAHGEKAADLPDRNSTRLQAWDPVARKEVWSVKTPGTWNGGLMATAGNLVFEGMGDGTFNAFDARSGQKIWTFDAHFGIAGAPISYEVDGKQYVSIVAGWGGGGAGVGGASSAKYGWHLGQQVHRVLTFQLDGKTALPPQAPPSFAVPVDDPKFVIDAKRAQAGNAVAFREMCVGCHGAVLIASSYAPDLRASPIPLSAEAFRDVVKHGSRLARGMPKYADISEEDLESLRHFIRQRARDALPKQNQ
jgi:quinohemoprotein ethanol dehydrogenase